MPVNLVELIQDTLSHVKDSHRIIEDLDPHAPVELHFGNTPVIRVTQLEDDEIQLISRLTLHEGLPASANTLAIIEIASAPAAWATHGCISLLDIGGQLHLHAIVAKPYLADGNMFSVSLAGFYDRLYDICQAMKG